MPHLIRLVVHWIKLIPLEASLFENKAPLNVISVANLADSIELSKASFPYNVKLQFLSYTRRRYKRDEHTRENESGILIRFGQCGQTDFIVIVYCNCSVYVFRYCDIKYFECNSRQLFRFERNEIVFRRLNWVSHLMLVISQSLYYADSWYIRKHARVFYNITPDHLPVGV